MGWFRRWTELAHYAYPVVALFVLAATVLLSEPGRHALVLGPVRFDAYWAGVGAALCLLVLSVLDRYDPGEYGHGAGD